MQLVFLIYMPHPPSDAVRLNMAKKLSFTRINPKDMRLRLVCVLYMPASAKLRYSLGMH
jgi:hypothetical protein